MVNACLALHFLTTLTPLEILLLAPILSKYDLLLEFLLPVMLADQILFCPRSKFHVDGTSSRLSTSVTNDVQFKYFL